MRILGIIPARSGSKGVPGKNHKDLAGKPLIQYTFQSAKSAKNLSSMILTSDDETCMTIAKQLNIKVPFVRPEYLSQENTPTLPVIQHAVCFLKNQGQNFDSVCILQTTYPFRPPGFIDEALLHFCEGGYDSFISVVSVPHTYNPHWVFENDKDGLLKIATGEDKIISTRQELPKAFVRDGAIYIVKTDVLMEDDSLYGVRIGYMESDPEYYINIDTLEDWEKAEKIAPGYLDRYFRGENRHFKKK